MAGTWPVQWEVEIQSVEEVSQFHSAEIVVSPIQVEDGYVMGHD